MRIDSDNPTLKLKSRQIVRLAEVRGVRIACRQGTVWITQDGDVHDFVLERGQTFASDRDGPVLIYGLGEAEVEILERAPANAAQFTARFAHAA